MTKTVWTFVLWVIWKTWIIPYLLPSSSDLSFFFFHLFLIFDHFSGLFLQHSKLRTAPPCKHMMVLHKHGKLVFLHFLPVKPERLLSFRVTETPWAGDFRQQSVATVIPLSELSSRRYPGFFLPRPGLAPACPRAHMPTAVRSHSLSGSASISPYLGGIFTCQGIPQSSDHLWFHRMLTLLFNLYKGVAWKA